MNKYRLYNKIMHNIAKGIKQTLNEDVIVPDGYFQSEKIFKALYKALKDNPDIILEYPAKRSIAAKITFKDPYIIKRLSKNSIMYNEKDMWLEILPDLSARLARYGFMSSYNDYDYIELPELKFKSIKDLVEKISNLSFFNNYKSIDDELKTLELSDLVNTVPDKNSLYLAKRLINKIKTFNFQLKSELPPEYISGEYSTVEISFTACLKNKSNNETWNNQIKTLDPKALNNPETETELAKYIDFSIKHESIQLELYFAQFHTDDKIKDIFKDFAYTIKNDYDTQYESYLTMIHTNTKNDIKQSIKELIDICQRFTDFVLDYAEKNNL